MIILIIGGASSGKSDIAENIAMNFGGKKCYIATMNPSGNEGKLRVERHTSRRRDKGFETIEKYFDLDRINCIGYNTVLLECVSNLLANEYFREDFDEKDGIVRNEKDGNASDEKNEIVYSSIRRGFLLLKKQVENLVIVTNDIFRDGIDYDNPTMEYMECLGKVNRFLAADADVVIESVCGVSVFIKGAIGI